MMMTPWVKRILIATIVVYFVAPPGSTLYHLLTFNPAAVFGVDQFYIPSIPFRPWTLVSYIFLHASFAHILFNMIGLFFFGPRLESKLGGKSFLYLYFLSGIGGALLSMPFMFNARIVGASGAVYGVVLGFAYFWPRERIYIWGVLPVQAWLLATFLVLSSLYSGITGSNSGVANFAHLGGLAAGFAYLKWSEWHTGKDRREFQRKLRHTPSMDASDNEIRRRWATIRLDGLHELNRGEVEELLAKVEASGVRSLSPDQRMFLDRMAGSV
ncbi:MAG: rhomboid family intramembrane serine protease [Longimicrobiales bacterium]